MKKLWALFICLLLFVLPAATLELETESGVSDRVRLSVKRALERSMLPRLKADETLIAQLTELSVLRLQVGERTLTLDIATDDGDLEEYLVSNLHYDGLSLLQDLPLLGLEVALDRGFAVALDSEKHIREGLSYWVLDGQGDKRGVVVATHVRKNESKLAFLQQTAGKELSLGMGLVPMGSFPLSLHFSLHQGGTVGFAFDSSYPLPSYPFRVLFGLTSPDLKQGFLVVGLGSELPLSILFSSKTQFVRAISLEGRALVGIGTAFTGGGLLYYSEGSLALVYRMGALAFSLGGGNRVSATSAALTHQGLFLSLGTSYTYTP